MRPQVVAHRGASHEIAEHTLGAYLEALSAGAEALECDVRLTADGHLVCVHDRTLRRVAGFPGVVSEMELADLEELDVSSWKNDWEVAPDLVGPHGSVLTLRTLLETVAAYPRRVELAVETKHPTRYGGLVERRLAQMLREFGWHRSGSPVRVMSFQYTALQRMDRLLPELQKVLLIDKAQYWPFYQRIVESNAWWLGPGIKELTEHPKFARRMRASGRPIHVWTVNDTADLELCLDLDVTAVISDRPGWAMEQLDRRWPRSGDQAWPRVAGRGEEVPSQVLRADG
jgi:glycerophosphoryl diester phosphodiesterase